MRCVGGVQMHIVLSGTANIFIPNTRSADFSNTIANRGLLQKEF